MTIGMEQIQVGKVFRFAKADRRVVRIRNATERGFMVDWVYADGKTRGGRSGGSQWSHYFRLEAFAEVTADDVGERTLLSGRKVGALKEPVMVAVATKCPSKWGLVDLETADVWVDQGGKLVMASADVLDELASAIAKARGAI